MSRTKQPKKAAAKRTRGAALLFAFLVEKDVTYKSAGEAVRVTGAAVCSWARGDKRPSAACRAALEVWTNGRVPTSAWDSPEERKDLESVQPFGATGTDAGR